MPDETTRRLREHMAAAAVEALHKCGDDLLGKAQRLAPVEEGTLRGSAALALIVGGSRFEGSGALAGAVAAARATAAAGLHVDVAVEVSFNTVYAARQHEETTWQHPKGGQAKYLEEPFRAGLNRYARIVGGAVSVAERL